MKDFSFQVIQNCVFGMGIINKLPGILQDLDVESIMLVSDRMLEKLGVVESIRKVIEDAGITYNEYLDVLPNPSTDTVDESAALYNSCGAKAFLALGGGSPMDVAKAAGVVAKCGGSIGDYEGVNKVPCDIDPIIAIPTTAGTGSEVTNAAVITDEARNYKLSVLSDKIAARYAVLDPALIMTAPASVAAACGIDAMIHALEAYINTAATPFSDMMSEKALELIGVNLKRFVANRMDEDAASAMMAASTFAGISFSHVRLGNVHAMSHPVSAFYHVAHGVANAILLPYVLEYNAIADRGRYRKIMTYLCGKDPGDDFEPMDLVAYICKMNSELGIPATLRDVGVEEDKIDLMAEDAMKSGNVLVNPRQTGLEDIKQLYLKALNGF